MFLDGPDFNIPTVCLGRDYWPFYHTDRDIPQNASFGQLSESLELMKKFVQVIEDDRILHRKYKGPLYLSRYGLVYDAKKNRDAYDHVRFCQMMMDGRNSCLDVADAVGCSYGFVDDFAKRVEGLGLMETTPFVVG
jgi:aminopeptidase-like protein